jgi:carbon starvation protein
LFGIANQLLAAIALCLATTVILKMQLNAKTSKPGRPAFALLTLVPLLWLLLVTITAGVQKIGSADTRIGFLSLARVYKQQTPGLEAALRTAKNGAQPEGIVVAEKALRQHQRLIFNLYLDAVVAAVFLGLVSIIAALSFAEWWRLLAGKRQPNLHESPPVWLPDYAIVEGKPMNLAGSVALGLALMKELSGEADMERSGQQQVQAACCAEHQRPEGGQCAEKERQFLAHLETRYRSIRRCC